MSRAPQATGAAVAAPTPPAYSTRPFDRLPPDVINIVIAHACPSTTLLFRGDDLHREPHDDDHALLALRSTCRGFEQLCRPFVYAVWGTRPVGLDPSTERLLGVLRVSWSRARRCRRLVFNQTSSSMIQRLRGTQAEWAEVLPVLDEVVLSGTATFDLSYLAVFPRASLHSLSHSKGRTDGF